MNALDIALSGMKAAQLGAEVAGHNIANAGVDGYTRQRALLASRTAQVSGHTLVDGGVQILGIQRISDRWTVRQIRQQTTEQSYYNSLHNRLTEIETILGEGDDTGIQNAFNEFFSNLSKLADSPESRGVRQTTIGAAQLLASRLRRAHGQLQTMDRELRSQLGYEITGVNNLLDRVASLNEKIASGVAVGSNVSDLQDERERILQQVASKLPVQVNITANEALATVSVNGLALVNTNYASHIAVNSDGIYVVDTNTPLTVQSGQIGAMIELRDEIIPRYLSDLDSLASTLINGFNAQHRAGYGLDGSTGLDLFTGLGAGNIQVNTAIQADPGKLAASGTSKPGDSSNALALLDLREQPLIGSLTLEEFYQGIIGGIGAETLSARTQETGVNSLLRELTNRRDSIHAVSLDEEMVDLIRFQQAYSASARVVSVVQEMIDAILRLGR